MISVNEGNTPKIEDNSILIQESYANQPIPNNRLPKGMYYSFKNKWVNILLLLTPDIKKIIASNTTTPTWGSITGTLSAQTDLQSALNAKMSSELTDSHIFVGNTSNEATDVEMTGDVTIDNTGATTLANTAVTAGTYGDATNVPQLIVDSKGRLTGVTNVAVLGYTAENVANKATSLTSPDNTKYPTTQAVADGLALKANITDVETILFKSNTQTTVTGKIVESCIYSIPLPVDGNNYKMEIYSQSQVSPYSAGSCQHRFRVGTYLAPIDGAVGANSIGMQTGLGANGVNGAQQMPLTRRMSYKGGNSGTIWALSSGSNIADDATSTAVFATLKSADFTTQHYLYVSLSSNNASNVMVNSIVTVKLIKI